MRRSFASAAVVLFVATAGCGEGPTAPAAPDPARTEPVLLPAGRYALTASSRFDTAGCAGRLDSWGLFGPMVTGLVMLSIDGDGWSARGHSADDADFELKLRRAGPGLSVTGSIRGRLTDYLDPFFTLPPRAIVFAGSEASASATLTLEMIKPGGIGRAEGGITFAHTSGTTVACREVSVFLLAGP